MSYFGDNLKSPLALESAVFYYKTHYFLFAFIRATSKNEAPKVIRYQEANCVGNSGGSQNPTFEPTPSTPPPPPHTHTHTHAHKHTHTRIHTHIYTYSHIHTHIHTHTHTRTLTHTNTLSSSLPPSHPLK